jgi:hypothetical protein
MTVIAALIVGWHFGFWWGVLAYCALASTCECKS